MALMAQVENLTVQGGQDFDVYGSDLANQIYGNLGGNRLQCGLGKDVLCGGDSAVLAGPGGDDRLFGGAGDDSLIGSNGLDWLRGDGGRDVLRGSLGDDSYVLDRAADQAVELTAEGYDIVRATVTALSGGDLAQVEVLSVQGVQNLGRWGGDEADRQYRTNALTLGGMDGESLYRGAGDVVVVVGAARTRSGMCLICTQRRWLSAPAWHILVQALAAITGWR